MYVSWLYFLENKDSDQEIFLYGITLPYNESIIMNSTSKKIGILPTKEKIKVYFSVNEFNFHDVIDEHSIYFNNINNNINQVINYVKHSLIIQNKNHYNMAIPSSPTASSIHMNVFYTKDFFEYKEGALLEKNNHQALLALLEILEKDTGQNFTDGYCKRLGCYEYTIDPIWTDDVPPFSISKKDSQYIFNKGFYKGHIFLHLKVYSRNKEIILDELHQLDTNTKEYKFARFLDNDDSYEYWVFDEQGILLHNEFCYWIQEINLGMHVLGQNIHIQYDKDKEIITSKGGYSTNISVKAPQNEINNIINIRQNNIYNSIKPKINLKENLLQKYFSREDVYQTKQNPLQEVIDFFNENIFVENSSIYFIDPFISKQSILPLMGINKSKVNLYIVSAWDTKDPDEDPDIAEKQEIKDIQDRTIELIKNVDFLSLPISKVKWYNLHKSSFHDRYIYIKSNTTNNVRVFSISNSLNNLLKKYDLSVFEFNEASKVKVVQYLEKLLKKCDLNNLVYPKVKND